MIFQSLYKFCSNRLSNIVSYFKRGVPQPHQHLTLLQVLTSRDKNDLSTIQLVIAMLKRGADVNEKGWLGKTPLMEVASTEDCEAMLQVLLDHGANLCDQDIKGRTALMCTINAESERNALFLLKFTQNCDFLNLYDRLGDTALCTAARLGKVKLVREMIDRGADVNTTTDVGWNSPLFALFTSSNNPNKQILEMLLKAGSDVDYQERFGRFSPLMLAASRYTPRSFTIPLTSGDEVVIRYIPHYAPYTFGTPECFSKMPNLFYLFNLLNNESDKYQNSYDVYKTLLTANPSYERTLTIILEAGADVNAVWKMNSTKTALSFLPSVTFCGEVTIFCMDKFLERYARSRTVNPVVLQEVILHGAIDVIPKLIQCGLLPAEIEANKPDLCLDKSDNVTLVSPLCLALLTGNVSLAHYFMGNVFLTSSDVSTLFSNKRIRNILERKKHYKCLKFFDDMAAEPMSLSRQAFVKVSSAIGTSPGRGRRVEQLPIPRLLKDCLLYNTKHVKLGVPEII